MATTAALNRQAGCGEPNLDGQRRRGDDEVSATPTEKCVANLLPLNCCRTKAAKGEENENERLIHIAHHEDGEHCDDHHRHHLSGDARPPFGEHCLADGAEAVGQA
jgi:hypothetical protein